MEKKRHKRSKGTNYFPKAASFGVHPRPSQIKALKKKGFSAPIVFNVSSREPRSPEISCMGQVKYKGKKVGQQTSFGKKVLMGICRMFRRKVNPDKEKEKSDGERREAPQLRGMFRQKVKPDKEKEKSDGERREAPQLREIRRFASKRESGLDGFDWRATQRLDDDDEGEEKVRIGRKSELVVMLVGGGIDVEPKEEVNLWKRRTMAPPIPLVLSS